MDFKNYDGGNYDDNYGCADSYNYNSQMPQNGYNANNQKNSYGGQNRQTYNNNINDDNFQNSRPEISVLMVAEKPSIAKTISDAMSDGGRYRSRKSESKYCQVHEFEHMFMNQPANIKVTSVTGHIYCRDFPKEYSDWYKTDPFTLFDAPTLKRESNPDNMLIKHLQTEAMGCNYLVLWLDNDKEGENICFEVLDITKDLLEKPVGTERQVFRAKFSSITKKDINIAFDALVDGPNFNESISVDARQIIDQKVGVAFSRFQSLMLKKRFLNLNQRMITFGPCQTPTLGFCVERYTQIKDFKSEAFWRICPKIFSNSGESIQLHWEKDRTNNFEEAEIVKKEIEEMGQIQVVEVINKESIKGRPEGQNTVQLLKQGSTLLGIGPNDTMHIAEKLYLGGYLTYPRTESTSYPKSFDFADILQSFSKANMPFSDYCNFQLNGINKPKNGVDAGDHPPITPTVKVPRQDQLGNQEYKLYEFVCRHFQATISPDAKFAKTKIHFAVGQNLFSLGGSVVLQHGFTEVTPWVKLSDKLIPEFKQGESYYLSALDLVEGHTTPPDYLTECELITLMEKNGIGTDASMATHIQNIVERNYVTVVGKMRKLMPTNLGSSLVSGYNNIDPELVSATLRSNIEKNMELIAKGQADYDSVQESVLNIFKQKFVYFRENIAKMEYYFGATYGTFDEALQNAEDFSECGKCGNMMKLVKDFSKIHCHNCRLTLNLPRDSEYSFNDKTKEVCPLDGFQIIHYYILREGLETKQMACPQCYHRSPFPDFSQRVICGQCPNTQCQFSQAGTEVINCSKCVKGSMILNQNINGKYYQTCNENTCTNILVAAENAINCTRTDQKCTTCEAYFLNINFRDGEELSTCIFCDPEYRRYIYKPEIRMRNKNYSSNQQNDQVNNRRNTNNNNPQQQDKRQFNNKVTERKAYNNNTTGGKFNPNHTNNNNRGKFGDQPGSADENNMRRSQSFNKNNSDNYNFNNTQHSRNSSAQKPGFAGAQNMNNRFYDKTQQKPMQGGPSTAQQQNRFSTPQNAQKPQGGNVASRFATQGQTGDGSQAANRTIFGDVTPGSGTNQQVPGIGPRSKTIVKGKPGMGMRPPVSQGQQFMH